MAAPARLLDTVAPAARAPAPAAKLGAAAGEPDLCLILTDKDAYFPLV